MLTKQSRYYLPPFCVHFFEEKGGRGCNMLISLLFFTAFSIQIGLECLRNHFIPTQEVETDSLH